VLPDRDPLHRLRRGGRIPLSVGGDLPRSRALRVHRDGSVRVRPRARLRLRLAEGRARLGMSGETLLARVATLVPAAQPFPSDAARGEAVVIVPRDALPDALGKLRDDAETRLEQLSDLTAVDYLGRTPRFEVVYQLYSITLNHRLRVKVPVPE